MPPQKKMVTIRILREGPDVPVKCSLTWTWSWLQARIKLKYPPTLQYSVVHQIKKNQFSVLEYWLNPSTGQEDRSVINLFIEELEKAALSTSRTLISQI